MDLRKFKKVTEQKTVDTLPTVSVLDKKSDDVVKVEHLSIQQTTSGALTLVDDINDDVTPSTEDLDVSVENIIHGIIPTDNTPAEFAAPNQPKKDATDQLGVYSIDGKQVTIVIGGGGNRAMTLAPGIIASATSDMIIDLTITTIYADMSKYIYLELAHAVRESKATVNIHLSGNIPATALAMMLIEGANVDIISAGVLIMPIMSAAPPGSANNIVEIAEAYTKYTTHVLNTLVSHGLLTAEEGEALKNRKYVHYTYEQFTERYAALKTA